MQQLKALRGFCISLALCSLKGWHFFFFFSFVFVLNTKDSAWVYATPLSVTFSLNAGVIASSSLAEQHAWKVSHKDDRIQRWQHGALWLFFRRCGTRPLICADMTSVAYMGSGNI